MSSIVLAVASKILALDSSDRLFSFFPGSSTLSRAEMIELYIKHVHKQYMEI
jgi:hypothetical protein